MFPIPWNKTYRKKDGSLTIIDDMFVDAPELQEEIDALDERLDSDESNIEAFGGRVTALEDATEDCWVISAHDQSMTLSTADGTKTVSQILAEADAAIKAINVPAGYGYEILGLVIANGDGTNSQVAIDNFSVIASVLTNLSSFGFRGYRVGHGSNGNSIATYSVYLPDQYFGTYSVSLNTGDITGYKKYGSEKPAAGTNTYMRYNLWKKL